ncbi:MAG: hypothetical protein PARBA_02324 [Parabacteroides sp.]
MKCLKKVFICCIMATILLTGNSHALQAQTSDDDFARNQIKLSYGDAFYSTVAFGLLDILMGGAIFHPDAEMSAPGSFSMAYRYLFEGERFALGGDFTYIPIKQTEKNSTTHYDLFATMVGADVYYIKSGIFRLYGTASIGAAFAQEAAGFAFQVNPIAIRLGNDKFSGFLEAGAGYKGICNVGIQIGF